MVRLAIMLPARKGDAEYLMMISGLSIRFLFACLHARSFILCSLLRFRTRIFVVRSILHTVRSGELSGRSYACFFASLSLIVIRSVSG